MLDDNKKQLGEKYDHGKPRYELLPWQQVTEIVNVLTVGAQKYQDNNWQHVVPTSRYVGAMFRHITAWISGKRTDEESGLSHLAHAACCILFLMWFDDNRKGGIK